MIERLLPSFNYFLLLFFPFTGVANETNDNQFLVSFKNTRRFQHGMGDVGELLPGGSAGHVPPEPSTCSLFQAKIRDFRSVRKINTSFQTSTGLLFMNAANQDWILDLREHLRRATKFANIDAEIPCKQNTQCQTM